ncbi:MAG: MBL fold metallo-hydrolase [Methyloceanibacter sp.]
MLTTILTPLLLNTAIAQEIIKDKPTPSRAEWAPLGWAYGRDYSTSDVTKVVVIGSGTSAADPHHGGISVAVVVNDQPYIIDCGPGFWRNSQANTPAYGGTIAALEAKKLTRLFLTHLHFDHTEGFAESGELIEVEAVESFWRGKLKGFRNRVLAIPHRVEYLSARQTLTLTQELRACLDELADDGGQKK